MSAIERVSREQFAEPNPGLEYLSFDDAGPMLEALSSSTAQSIFVALSGNPATPAELADRTETSVQNVSYHLSKLEDAGVVTAVGTRYSEKGREMTVYARAVAGFVIGERPDAEECT
ncbi:MAG: ArsR/SmtB family transcription factor [Haloferacaceae archaeon]